MIIVENSIIFNVANNATSYVTIFHNQSFWDLTTLVTYIIKDASVNSSINKFYSYFECSETFKFARKSYSFRFQL